MDLELIDPLTKLYSEEITIRDEYFTAKNKGASDRDLEAIDKKLEENKRKILELYHSGNIRLQNGTKYYPHKINTVTLSEQE